VLGADAESAYWERLRSGYYRTGAEGRASILDGTAGRLPAYRKGPWVFRALRHALGDRAFDAGMRAYVSRPIGASAGLEELVAAMSAAAGRDVRPVLLPWLTEKTLPDVEARVEDGRAIVRHVGTPVELPRLTLALETAGGTVTRRIDLRAAAETLDVRDLGAVAAVRVDPAHDYLLRRRWGDSVRLALPAASAPNAASVQAWGDFAPGRRLDARREGDRWVVDLVAPEGIYEWGWLVDGKPVRAAGGPVPLRVEAKRLLARPLPM